VVAPEDGAAGIEPLPPLGGVPEGGPTDCIAERTFASEMPSFLASAAAMSCGLDDDPDDGRMACIAFCSALVETPSFEASALRSGSLPVAAAGALPFAADVDCVLLAAPQPAAPTMALTPTITASLRLLGFIVVLLAFVGRQRASAARLRGRWDRAETSPRAPFLGSSSACAAAAADYRDTPTIRLEGHMTVNAVGASTGAWAVDPGQRPPRPDHARMLEPAAKALGLSNDELETQPKAGKSLSDVATAQGVSKDDLVSEIAADLKTHAPQGPPPADAQAKLASLADSLGTDPQALLQKLLAGEAGDLGQSSPWDAGRDAPTSGLVVDAYG
jgi:hypothetical protein